MVRRINREFVVFQDRQVFHVVRPEPGAYILTNLTRMEYKEDNGKFVKCKVCMIVRGGHQGAGESFQETDLYAPVLKATEARPVVAKNS